MAVILSIPKDYHDTSISPYNLVSSHFEGAHEVGKSLKFSTDGTAHFISFMTAHDINSHPMGWLDVFNIDKRSIMDADPLLVLSIEVPGSDFGLIGNPEWKPEVLVASYFDYFHRRESEPLEFFRNLSVQRPAVSAVKPVQKCRDFNPAV